MASRAGGHVDDRKYASIPRETKHEASLSRDVLLTELWCCNQFSLPWMQDVKIIVFTVPSQTMGVRTLVRQDADKYRWVCSEGTIECSRWLEI